MDGPYSQGYDYDEFGNITHRYGWGGEKMGDNPTHTPPERSPTYTGNRRTDGSFAYDAAGNLKNDGTQTYAYDATGQQTSATWSEGTYAPTFTDDPLNPGGTHTDIKLVHLTELRTEVNKLRMRAGLPAVTNWSPDPSPQVNVTYVHHNHITQLRTKLEEAYTALHLSIGTYAHAGPNANDTIYADDFQELRTKIKTAWSTLTSSWVTTQAYDGNGLRVKKNEYGTVTYYLRSTVLGGQVVGEINGSATWDRGYVYSREQSARGTTKRRVLGARRSDYQEQARDRCQRLHRQRG